MISLGNAVYKYFLKLVSKVQESMVDSTSTGESIVEPDSVYYRFCGAG